jgi:tRNA A37 methylthiotransferase MiaB
VRHNSVFHEKRKLQKEIKNERGIRINKDREKKRREKNTEWEGKKNRELGKKVPIIIFFF